MRIPAHITYTYTAGYGLLVVWVADQVVERLAYASPPPQAAVAASRAIGPMLATYALDVPAVFRAIRDTV